MPGKKEQIALQKEITNQEQWEDLMTTEGVIVVDVYQKWCGPCNAVVSLFRRIRNETGDDLLKLAVAEADSIDALEKYRGKCEPCFLFFAGGQLVHVIRGSKGPSISKAVIAELAAEHRVMDEGAERKVIVDPLLEQEAAKERAKSRAEEEEQKKADEEAMKPKPKEVTVLLVKPDAVEAAHTDEIVEKLKEHGFEILTRSRRTLTEEEAREFYKEQEGEEHFEDLIKFMTSGDSDVFVVTKGDTGEGVVGEIRTLLGPKDVSVAKEEDPESLRALYGTDTTMNALHAADSGERAARELTFFFPDFVVPTIPGTGPPPRVEKTLALIRPEALKEHKDAILEKIHEAGFEVCFQKEVQLTEEQAKSFYTEHEGEPFYEDLITEMTRGPVLALGLAKEEAIQGWRDLLGPKEVQKAKEESPESLRAQFSMTDASINGIHGSDSEESATKELEFFFPKEHTLAVIKPDAAGEHKDAITERLHEAGFQISSEKHVELSREMAAQLYQEHEGKEFYDSLLDHMTSGPSTVLLLHREDAIHGLRTLMGPTDPDVAREQAPESFRALLGKDILNNAIHGSSSVEHLKKKVEHFFPEVEVTEAGHIVVPTKEEETEAESEEIAETESKERGNEGYSSGENAEDETEEMEEEDGEETESAGEEANQDEEEMRQGEDDGYEDEEFEEGEEKAEGDQEEDGNDVTEEDSQSVDDKADTSSDKEEEEGEEEGEEELEGERDGDNKSDTSTSGEEGKGGGEGEEMTELPLERKQGAEAETGDELLAEKTELPADAGGEEGEEKKQEDGEDAKDDDGGEEKTEKEDTAEGEMKQEEAPAEESAPAGEEASSEEKQEEAPPATEEKPADADAPTDGADDKEEAKDAPAAEEDKTEDAQPDAPTEAPTDAPADAPADAPTDAPADAPADEEEKKEEEAPVEQAAE